jgi:hypothetical protein
MSTPQAPGRRRRQKARRTKQLAAWRAKNPTKAESVPAGSAAPTKITPAAGKKTAAAAPKSTAVAAPKKLASK